MNIKIGLNLLNVSFKKCFFQSKCFRNYVFFRNIFSVCTKNSSNHLINDLILRNNRKKFNKLLLTSKECPKVSPMACVMSSESLDVLSYERMADQTLEHLNEELERILEQINGQDSDVSLSSGVITFNLGKHGIYVINKQTPNKQIWLSSPISGPKRYDYMDNDWIYKHDGVSLFSLLNSELSALLKSDINIKSISHLSS